MASTQAAAAAPCFPTAQAKLPPPVCLPKAVTAPSVTATQSLCCSHSITEQDRRFHAATQQTPGTDKTQFQLQSLPVPELVVRNTRNPREPQLEVEPNISIPAASLTSPHPGLLFFLHQSFPLAGYPSLQHYLIFFLCSGSCPRLSFS